MLSTLLPDDTSDVKAQFFDRSTIRFNNVDLRSHSSIPIIAVSVAYQNKVSFSFWDPCRNKVLKQVDFTSNSISY